jgi:hypothetical protein
MVRPLCVYNLLAEPPALSSKWNIHRKRKLLGRLHHVKAVCCRFSVSTGRCEQSQRDNYRLKCHTRENQSLIVSLSVKNIESLRLPTIQPEPITELTVKFLHTLKSYRNMTNSVSGTSDMEEDHCTIIVVSRYSSQFARPKYRMNKIQWKCSPNMKDMIGFNRRIAACAGDMRCPHGEAKSHACPYVLGPRHMSNFRRDVESEAIKGN